MQETHHCNILTCYQTPALFDGQSFEGRAFRAFTLIELLVVISIVSLLIAILLPALAGARVAAQQVACLSNIRQLGIGIKVYLQDYKDHLPVQYPMPGNTPSNYLRHKDVVHNGSRIVGLGLLEEYNNMTRDVFRCPGRAEHGKVGGSVVFADYVTSWPRLAVQASDARFERFSSPNFEDYITTEIVRSKGGSLGPNMAIGRHILIADVRAQTGFNYSPDGIPHNGTANVLIYDGHAKTLGRAFGPDATVQSLSTRYPNADWNDSPYHDYGTDWWYWAEKEVRGF